MDKEEHLIRTLEKLSLEVQTLKARFDTGIQALEQRLDDRLSVVERQVSEIGSGLAVVLSRSDSNRTEVREAKKKPASLRGGRTGLPNAPVENLPAMTAPSQSAIPAWLLLSGD